MTEEGDQKHHHQHQSADEAVEAAEAATAAAATLDLRGMATDGLRRLQRLKEEGTRSGKKYLAR